MGDRGHRGDFMGIKNRLKKNEIVKGVYYILRFSVPRHLFGPYWDIWETKRKFKNAFHRELDLEDPQTLNEKIQWLKFNERKDFHTICADKLAARQVWAKYGEGGLIPLLYQTDDWRDITLDVIPDIPAL